MAEPRAATVTLPGQGEIIDVVGDRYRYLATREVTAGRYGIWEATVPPGGGPPPHVHSREEEGFYVIEGEVMIHVDGQQVVAGPGSFVNMPVGSTHWFRNETERPAKMLILVAPGGMEALFRKTGTPVDDHARPITPVDDEEKRRLVAFAPEFGIEILRPPAPDHS